MLRLTSGHFEVLPLLHQQAEKGIVLKVCTSNTIYWYCVAHTQLELYVHIIQELLRCLLLSLHLIVNVIGGLGKHNTDRIPRYLDLSGKFSLLQIHLKYSIAFWMKQNFQPSVSLCVPSQAYHMPLFYSFYISKLTSFPSSKLSNLLLFVHVLYWDSLRLLAYLNS